MNFRLAIKRHEDLAADLSTDKSVHARLVRKEMARAKVLRKTMKIKRECRQ